MLVQTFEAGRWISRGCQEGVQEGYCFHQTVGHSIHVDDEGREILIPYEGVQGEEGQVENGRVRVFSSCHPSLRE